MNLQNTGFAMMIKALGIDPAFIVAKGEELERIGKALALELQAKVTDIDARLSRIEGLLLVSLQRQDAASGHVLPAGETSPVVAITPHKETHNNARRATGTHGENRSARAAGGRR